MTSVVRLGCVIAALIAAGSCINGPSESERLSQLPIRAGDVANTNTPLSETYRFGSCDTGTSPRVRLSTVPPDLQVVLCIDHASSGDSLNAEYFSDAAQAGRDSAFDAFEHGAILLSERALPSLDEVRSLDAGDGQLAVSVGARQGVARRLGPKTFSIDWRTLSDGKPIEVVLIGGRDPNELLTMARNLQAGTPSA
jgi:hypothetical protein